MSRTPALEVLRPTLEEALAPDLCDALRAHLDALVDPLARRCSGASPLWASACAVDQGARPPAWCVRLAFEIPVDVALGLAAWRDTDEGAWEVPGHGEVAWVGWEVEKAVRLTLRQSHAALEWLAGAVLLDFEGRAALDGLLAGAVGAGAAHTCLQVARGLALGAEVDGAWWPVARHALTGLGLARQGRLCTHGPWLRQWALTELPGVGALDAASGARAALGALAEEVAAGTGALPAGPRTYDALSRWLVERRLGSAPT